MSTGIILGLGLITIAICFYIMLNIPYWLKLCKKRKNESLELEKDYYEIQCEKNSIYELKKKLENHIKDFISTDIEWKPINKIKLTEGQMLDIKKLINYLMEN